jgi:hypothetical protein
VTATIDAPAAPSRGGAELDPAPPPPDAVRWLRRLWPVPAVLAVLAALTLVPDFGSSGPAPGEAFVTIDGSARIERVDGTVEVVDGGAGGARPGHATLRQGDRFDLVDGRADLELAGSIQMQAVASTSIVMGRTPDLRTGRLLVTGAQPTEVGSGGTRLRFGTAEGHRYAGRVARTAGLSIGLYLGRAEIDSAGTTRTLTALRRADVPALGEITGGQPLRYDREDAWDRRYLRDAMVLDERLASVLPGLVDRSRRDGGTVASLVAVLGAVDGMPSRRTLSPLVDPDRPLDDVLVGATISRLAEGDFAAQWRGAFRFRDAGATWGLVTLDRGLTSKAVLQALDRVVKATPLDFADRPSAGGSPGGSRSGTGGASGTGAGGGGTGTRPSGGGGGGGGGGSGGGGTDDTVVTLPPVLPTIPPTTLPPLPPATTNPVGGIVGGVGDVVDRVGDTVDDVVHPPPDDGPDCLLGILCS